MDKAEDQKELQAKKDAVRQSHPLDEIHLGDWFMVEWSRRSWEKDEPFTKVLCCVMAIGSNYILVEGVDGTHERIHSNKIDERLTPVNAQEAKKTIEDGIERNKVRMLSAIEEMKKITSDLGVSPDMNGPVALQGESSQAVAVVSSQNNVVAYEQNLKKARDTTLPDLQKETEKAGEAMAIWMKGFQLPLRAQTQNMVKIIKTIDSRIFNVGLYAGLSEQVKCVKGGKTASAEERLRIMQRRLYMDEESLLDYDTGGMEFRDINAFDAWIARPHNFERLLPFPRAMVSFKVRRITKEREETSLADAYINADIAQSDGKTFLYIRNGEQLWRMECNLNFGETMFPDDQEFDPSQPQMIAERGRSFISKGLYDQQLNEYLEKEKIRDQWIIDHPLEPFLALQKEKFDEANAKKPEKDKLDWEKAYEGKRGITSNWEHMKPNLYRVSDPRDYYAPYNKDSVYYDDATDLIRDKMEEYNRIALVIQGLLDRSETLTPHPPYQLWSQEGFAAAVELIFDSTRGLTFGEAPDFEAYRKNLNSTLKVGDLVIGQRTLFLIRGADRLYAEQSNDWRRSSTDRVWHRSKFAYHGDPGPEPFETVKEINKKGIVTFRWERERRNYRTYDAPIPESIKVNKDNLLNVSAYKKGDYLRFFLDPRTRSNYLKWAPLLLTAENYARGMPMEELEKRRYV